MNLRLTAIGPSGAPDLPDFKGGQRLEAAHLRTREAVFRKDGVLGTFQTGIYRRDLLPLGVPLPGPAILLQKDSTTVVPPGATVEVHGSGSLIITLEGEA